MMSSGTTSKDVLVGKTRTMGSLAVVPDDYEGAPSPGLLRGARRPRRGAARRLIFEARFVHQLDLKSKIR